ncbi:MAG: hypothetical protein AAF845_05715 [Bacteroidota bacterium]
MILVAPRTARTAAKAIVHDDGTATVSGYLVVFDDPEAPTKDLAGDYFTADTYFGAKSGDGADCLFHHGIPVDVKLAGLADTILPPLKVTRDDAGLFVEVVLDMADEYHAAIAGLAQKGALGWSSGSAPHMVKRADDGWLKRWPIIEGSLTPQPCEPRTVMKSLTLPEAAKAEDLTGRVWAVYDAFWRMADAAGDWDSYVAEVWDEYAIIYVSTVVAQGYYRAPYTYAAGVVTLAPAAEWEQVEPTTLGRDWEAVKAAYERRTTATASGSLRAINDLFGAAAPPPSAGSVDAINDLFTGRAAA